MIHVYCGDGKGKTTSAMGLALRALGRHWPVAICQFLKDGTSGEVPVEAVPGASTLGAGDAFHGAFVWAIERGGDADPERLIRFASAVAAVSVSSFGTRQWLTSPALVELVRG